MVLPKLSEMNPSMITAARDLGATSSQVLTRIVYQQLHRNSEWILYGLYVFIGRLYRDILRNGNGFSTIAVEIYSRARKESV